MTRRTITYEFVEFIPKDLIDGRVYISIPFTTVTHKCCCGCGHEVVTPLSPADWTLTFDGDSISLHPSIGNWSFPCQSHYWIRDNRVLWARRWSQAEIEAGRAKDHLAKQRYFGPSRRTTQQSREESRRPSTTPWDRLKEWWRVKRQARGTTFVGAAKRGFKRLRGLLFS